jgi:hypothetical protein
MRRVLVAIVCGAIVAVPAGVAVGSTVAPDNDNVVPATECPAAAAAVEAVSGIHTDTFVGDCPDPASIQPVEPEGAVADRAEACEEYGPSEQPGWCPSDAEIAAADGTEG